MSFSVGSLVRARGREWVVLPESAREDSVLWLRPLGGTDDEITGIYLPIEPVETARFSPPDPAKELGNARDLSMLRDALRLGFRSGAGPFRSFAGLGIEPRPYQLVPLLMALRQDPVRILVGDDVGIGKTVEALLIARELLDRGEIDRIAVLCPPHLADGWVTAMRDQFNIEAVPVLAGTAARLERHLGHESLFDRHPFAVVSMDFIKSEHRRAEFLRACPDFVIVDEAHGCAAVSGARAQQQRHALLRTLSQKKERHLVLVTATPHSGNEENFRSLLGLLDPGLVELPLDLSGDENRPWRERLARHMVQRRRGDLRVYLDADTPFPDRLVGEESYEFSPAYRSFLEKVLGWCRERVADPTLDKRRQRVQWWSTLALLRSISSSPRAAAETLRSRAKNADAASEAEADALGRQSVLDQGDESDEGTDVVPGSQVEAEPTHPEHRRLLDFAREAEGLEGKDDKKAQRAAELVAKLVADGHQPIVFCRFIPTVDYFADVLEKKLGKDVHVERITGLLPPEDRALRIKALAVKTRRVLVCTDCLSEGINLKDPETEHIMFDAVFHYDLSWNPTRHEQREGRVDRFGQPKTQVKALTFFGKDNPVDGLVLEVILRKHNAIHQQLGISVPVPTDTDALMEALFEGGLLRKGATNKQLSLFTTTQKNQLDVEWQSAAEREKKSRALFAQHAIKIDEVRRELEETRVSLGDDAVVERFVRDTMRARGTPLIGSPALLRASDLPQAAREGIGAASELRVTFSDPVPAGVLRLRRTHPAVAGLAAWVAECALDPLLQGPARRCGVVRTSCATTRTIVLVLRARMQLVSPRRSGTEIALLAEDLISAGFSGSGSNQTWLDESAVNALLAAEPELQCRRPVDPPAGARRIPSSLAGNGEGRL
ncbi:MAG: DEAD/DEAH box helicase, partial [Polyangiaceae bacterium]|nr:DEAD/DEAH box helicase [Polyangiaceae bacterium]